MDHEPFVTDDGAGGSLPPPSSAISVKSLSGWVVRGAIIGLLVGCVVGLFRTSHDRLSAFLADRLSLWPEHLWLIPAWFILLVGISWVLGRLVKAEPLIRGSGIPQLELLLAGRLDVPRSRWPKVLAAKFAGSWLAVVAGLSLGREGPCIQMGGAVGAIMAGPGSAHSLAHHPAVVGGAAAGLAAAFGAPLAGVLFAFEEMRSRRSAPHILSALSASFSAQLVARHLFGLEQLFRFDHFRPPVLSQCWLIPLLGIVLGLMGILYNRSLLMLKDAEDGQTLLPESLRTLPPLMIAALLAFVCPQVLGGGDGLIVSLGAALSGVPLLAGFTVSALAIVLFVKFVFSLYSYTGGVPGGLLMPLVCIGALAGDLTGEALASVGLLDARAVGSFLVFAMSGLFAAIVRAPLTGIALVMEMTGAFACLPGAFVVSFLASGTATFLRCQPIYESLKERMTKPDGEFREKSSSADLS